jgi:protein-arginine kinase activator protein McsA
MNEAAAKMEFEKAAEFRDHIRAFEQRQLGEM